MMVGNLLERASERLATIPTSARLTEAAVRLGDGRVRLLVVCDPEGRMAGVVGRTDIVARISQCSGCTCTEAVAAAMTTEVRSCRPDEALDAVWARMRSGGFFHMPVVDEERHPLGVLTARDALEALLTDVSHEEDLLRDYVLGIGYR